MKSKKVMGLTIAAIMIASLAACGGSSDSGKGVEDSIDDDKIVINFFHRWPNDPKNSMFNELIEKYPEWKDRVILILGKDAISDYKSINFQ